MKPDVQRLFINNLENNVTEEEIRKKFSNYGTVKAIEIKERKNPVGNQTKQFAYVNISAEEHALHNCVQEFARKEWKGQFLNVQVAKESFIDRLKRERKEDVKFPEPVLNGSLEIKPINININRYQKQHSLNVPNELSKVVTNAEDGVTNHNQDNEKRLKSLMHMKEGYRQQKLQIKNALSNIDKASATNKIRFDNYPDNALKKSNSQERKQNRYKMQLFDEDDGEDNLNFKVQDQFDGVRGQKLMHLQSRFQNDDRFKMDSRFLDEEEQEGFTENTDLPENETEKQLEILESVLGKKLKRPSSTKEIMNKKKTKMMLRFDPSQPQHSQLEMQQEVITEGRSKKKEKKVPVKLVEEQPQPEVSKETFYKVTSDLKTTLNENEGFSLSKLFSTRIEQDTEKQNIEEPTVKLKILNKTQQTGHGQKVFRYDSSDEDDDDENNKSEAKLISSSEPNQIKDPGLQIKPRIWTETFFFKDDDYRLQEGLDFIMRMKHGEHENFNVVRRNLKQIIRAKVKNNLRKKGPFKRKLGGNKKRLKIKRSLKR